MPANNCASPDSPASPACVASPEYQPEPRRRGRNAPHSKFSNREDETLKRLVEEFGTENWNDIAEKLGTKNARQCRERWMNYLDPNINRKEFSEEEDKLLIALISQLGKKWVVIMSHFERRTDTQLKNRYNLLVRLNKRRKRETEKQKNETVELDIADFISPATSPVCSAEIPEIIFPENNNQTPMDEIQMEEEYEPVEFVGFENTDPLFQDFVFED